MARTARRRGLARLWDGPRRLWANHGPTRLAGLAIAGLASALLAALASYRAGDASFDADAATRPGNWLGSFGADLADLAIQSMGLAAWVAGAALLAAGLRLAFGPPGSGGGPRRAAARWSAALIGVVIISGALAAAAPPSAWPLATGLGGMAGDSLLSLAATPLNQANLAHAELIAAAILGCAGLMAMAYGLGARAPRVRRATAASPAPSPRPAVKPPTPASAAVRRQAEPEPAAAPEAPTAAGPPIAGPGLAIKPPKAPPRTSGRAEREISAGSAVRGQGRLPPARTGSAGQTRRAHREYRRDRPAAERPDARGRAGGVRGEGRDRPDTSRTGGDAV